MSDLQKRIDKYINSDIAQPIALGLISELQAHLRAANRGVELLSDCYALTSEDFRKLADRVVKLEAESSKELEKQKERIALMEIKKEMYETEIRLKQEHQFSEQIEE